MLVDLNKAKNVPDKELVVITTGSQGEPMSALARMASSDHKAIKIKPGDMVILSSSPVPGNELTVSNVVNQLVEKGAEVIYSDIADTHVSGHACQEEQGLKEKAANQANRQSKHTHKCQMDFIFCYHGASSSTQISVPLFSV